MSMVELSEDLDVLLDDVAKLRGGDKLFHLREAVLEYASERVAPRLAEEGQRAPLSGSPHASPIEGVESESAPVPVDDPIFGFMIGKGRIVGDIVGPIVPLEDWDMLR